MTVCDKCHRDTSGEFYTVEVWHTRATDTSSVRSSVSERKRTTNLCPACHARGSHVQDNVARATSEGS